RSSWPSVRFTPGAGRRTAGPVGAPGRASFGRSESERDVLFLVGRGRGGRSATRRGGRGVVAGPRRAVVGASGFGGGRPAARGGRRIVLVIGGRRARHLVAAVAVQELDPLGLDLDLGPLLAGVAVVPRLHLEVALDVDQPPFLQVLGDGLGLVVPYRHVD